MTAHSTPEENYPVGFRQNLKASDVSPDSIVCHANNNEHTEIRASNSDRSGTDVYVGG
jgi:hypothetical protein